jgi:tripeptidyl-peptidase-1
LFIDNGTNSQNFSLAAAEPDLDTQYTLGLASGVPVTFLSVGGYVGPGFDFTPYLDTVHYLCVFLATACLSDC